MISIPRLTGIVAEVLGCITVTSCSGDTTPNVELKVEVAHDLGIHHLAIYQAVRAPERESAQSASIGEEIGRLQRWIRDRLRPGDDIRALCAFNWVAADGGGSSDKAIRWLPAAPASGYHESPPAGVVSVKANGCLVEGHAVCMVAVRKVPLLEFGDATLKPRVVTMTNHPYIVVDVEDVSNASVSDSEDMVTVMDGLALTVMSAARSPRGRLRTPAPIAVIVDVAAAEMIADHLATTTGSLEETRPVWRILHRVSPRWATLLGDGKPTGRVQSQGPSSIVCDWDVVF